MNDERLKELDALAEVTPINAFDDQRIAKYEELSAALAELLPEVWRLQKCAAAVVECVSCEHCGFTFSVEHVRGDDIECANCETESLRAENKRLAAKVERELHRCDKYPACTCDAYEACRPLIFKVTND